jgi:hypothetical protein
MVDDIPLSLIMQEGSMMEYLNTASVVPQLQVIEEVIRPHNFQSSNLFDIACCKCFPQLPNIVWNNRHQFFQSALLPEMSGEGFGEGSIHPRQGSLIR